MDPESTLFQSHNTSAIAERQSELEEEMAQKKARAELHRMMERFGQASEDRAEHFMSDGNGGGGELQIPPETEGQFSSITRDTFAEVLSQENELSSRRFGRVTMSRTRPYETAEKDGQKFESSILIGRSHDGSFPKTLPVFAMIGLHDSRTPSQERPVDETHYSYGVVYDWGKRGYVCFEMTKDENDMLVAKPVEGEKAELILEEFKKAEKAFSPDLSDSNEDSATLSEEQNSKELKV